MSENEVKTENGLKSKLIKLAAAAVGMIITFLVGYMPMYFKEKALIEQQTVMQKSLTRVETSNLIAKSIVDARRGEYESARQETSDFFTRLNTEIEKGEIGAYPTEQNEKLKAVFKDRDAIITMLAQRDPASVERLNDIYMIYRQAVGEPVTKTATEPKPTNTNSAANAVNTQ